MNILVSEVFLSFQGEGLYVGRLRTFVRLATGCPLCCSICDTKYARNFGRYLTKDDLELIRKHPYVVFTGNEPLFGKGQEYIVKLTEKVPLKWVEVETNGTIIPEFFVLFDIVNLWTVSPKNPRMQLKPVSTDPKLLTMKERFKDYIVKFVYNNREDEQFIKRIIKKYGIPSDKVWIMPRGENRKIYLSYLPKAWEFAFRNRFNLSPRIHIETFDMRRGV